MEKSKTYWLRRARLLATKPKKKRSLRGKYKKSDLNKLQKVGFHRVAVITEKDKDDFLREHKLNTYLVPRSKYVDKVNSYYQNHLSKYLTTFLKTGEIKNHKRFGALFGCSLQTYIAYLKDKLPRGFTLLDYGNLWAIDHILPRSYFDFTSLVQVKACFHYTNTQPLTKSQNVQKNNKL